MKEDAPRIGERIRGLEPSVFRLIHPSSARGSRVTVRESAQAAAAVADECSTRPHEGRAAMNLTPEQIQEHITNLSAATVEDLDDLLHDLCCLAWPTTDGQNN
jgi:hypothetical protein